MRNRIKGLILSLCVIACMFSMSIVAWAEGNTTLYLTDSNPACGNTFQLKIVGSDTSNVTVKYNASVLSVETCDAPGYQNGDGSLTYSGKTAIVTFKANKAGSSSLVVSSDKITGASTTINVAGDTEGTDVKNTSDDSDFILNNNSYVLSERFTESEVPAGFTVETKEINSKKIKTLTRGNYTLVYLKPASDTNQSGRFYFYNATANSVSLMNMLGDVNSYAMILDIDEAPLESMVPSDINIGENQVSMYTIDDQEGLAFFYGMNEAGEESWYKYDINSEAYEAVNMEDYDTTGEDVAVDETSDLLFGKIDKRYLIAALIFLVVAIPVVVVNIILKKKEDEEEDDETSDSDEIIEDVVALSNGELEDEEDSLDESTEEADTEVEDITVDIDVTDGELGPIEVSEDDKNSSPEDIIDFAKDVQEARIEEIAAESEEDTGFAFWEDDKKAKKAAKAKAKKAKKNKKAANDDADSNASDDYKYDEEEVKSAKEIDIMDLNNF